MRIIVCIKQVSEKLNNSKNNNLIINPYDKFAIETALRLKEKYGGKVTAICMGPESAKKALKNAISLGVDEGVLLSSKDLTGSDTYATAYSLSKLIETIGEYDLIICGKQSIDGDTAQVGPQIAANLNIPQVCYVNNILEIRDNQLKVERKTNYGYDEIHVEMPTLITVEKDIFTLRHAKLKNVWNSEYEYIKSYDVKDTNINKNKIGINGSPTSIHNVYEPKHKKNCEIIDTGSKEKNVVYLVKKLKLFGVI